MLYAMAAHLEGSSAARNCVRRSVTLVSATPVTRLTKPQLEQERFTRPRAFNPDEYLRGSLTVFKGQDDYEAVVDFDAWATDLVRGRRRHATQESTELPEGCSRLRLFRYSSLLQQWELDAHCIKLKSRSNPGRFQ